MGFIEKMKSIISDLRKQGKTEQEVKEIVKEAADKATFPKKADIEERKINATGNAERAIHNASINEALMALGKIKKYMRRERGKKREIQTIGGKCTDSQ